MLLSVETGFAKAGGGVRGKAGRQAGTRQQGGISAAHPGDYNAVHCRRPPQNRSARGLAAGEGHQQFALLIREHRQGREILFRRAMSHMAVGVEGRNRFDLGQPRDPEQLQPGAGDVCVGPVGVSQLELWRDYRRRRRG